MKAKMLCPICGDPGVEHRRQVRFIPKTDYGISYIFQFLKCVACEFEFVQDPQMRANNKSYREARDGDANRGDGVTN